MYRLLFFISLIVFLSSCRRIYINEVEIVNNAEEDLFIDFESADGIKDTSITLPSGESAFIYKQSRRGKVEEFNCCPCEIEAFEVKVINSSKVLTKSFIHNKNWFLGHEEESKKVICNFTIEETDLQ